MRSIRSQLILTLGIGISLVAVATGAGLYEYMEEVLERNLDATLQAKADALANTVRYDGDKLHLLAGATPPALTHREEPFEFLIWRGNGSLWMRGGTDRGLPEDAAKTFRPGRRFADIKLGDGTSGRAVKMSFIPQADDDDDDRVATTSHETLSIVLAQDRHSIDGTLSVLLSGLILASGLVLIGGIAAITIGVRRGLRPLAEMGLLADQITPAALATRFPDASTVPAELQPITTKLNELLARLRTGFERERRFNAAIAHELRTPVAELRALCDVVLGWPDASTALEAVRDASGIAAEMTVAVENLMLLARCQAGADQLQAEAIDLAEAVAAKWQPLQARAAERTINVTFAIDPSASQVRVDPRALSVILRNILENAVVHAATGGQIEIASRAVDQQIMLTVGNTASGITADELPHLTEAFWRKDNARTGGGHVGLGLSLVESYSRLAGISMNFALPRSDWFEITLALPRG